MSPAPGSDNAESRDDPEAAVSTGDSPKGSDASGPRRPRDTERAPPPSSGLELGAVVAERYRLLALLGEGGMGKVYKAEHVHMRKQVAVKVLHNDVTTTPEVVARFEREAVAAGNISHPNVAQATDFGRLEDGSFFLVLEFVPGSDLRRLVKAGPMDPARAVRIVRQIVAGAAAAHAAGVIHRDLKPENIMLVDGRGDEDFVKVLDFGIAKIDAVGLVDTDAAARAPTSGPQPITKIGAVFGTPDYMAPEQAMGQPIDARADLYSIGIILFELLTGERPFRGGAVSLMRKHVLQEAPPLPPNVAQVVDPRLQAILTKLLQKSPSERYAGASELGAAIDEVLASAPLAAPVAPAPAPAAAVAASSQGAPVRTPPTQDRLPALPLARPKRRAPGPLIAALCGAGLLASGLAWLHVRRGESPGLAAGVTAPLAVASTDTLAALAPVVAPSAAPPSALSAASAASAASLVPGQVPGAAASAAAVAAPDDAEGDDAAAVDEAEDGGAVASRSSSGGAGGGARRGGARPSKGGHHKPGGKPPQRHTGPGGLYIPPPSQWFK